MNIFPTVSVIEGRLREQAPRADVTEKTTFKTVGETGEEIFRTELLYILSHYLCIVTEISSSLRLISVHHEAKSTLVSRWFIVRHIDEF